MQSLNKVNLRVIKKYQEGSKIGPPNDESLQDAPKYVTRTIVPTSVTMPATTPPVIKRRGVSAELEAMPVSELYKHVTGKAWATAKTEGFTDKIGSFKSNEALRQRLLDHAADPQSSYNAPVTEPVTAKTTPQNKPSVSESTPRPQPTYSDQSANTPAVRHIQSPSDSNFVATPAAPVIKSDSTKADASKSTPPKKQYQGGNSGSPKSNGENVNKGVVQGHTYTDTLHAEMEAKYGSQHQQLLQKYQVSNANWHKAVQNQEENTPTPVAPQPAWGTQGGYDAMLAVGGTAVVGAGTYYGLKKPVGKVINKVKTTFGNKSKTTGTPVETPPPAVETPAASSVDLNAVKESANAGKVSTVADLIPKTVEPTPAVGPVPAIASGVPPEPISSRYAAVKGKSAQQKWYNMEDYYRTRKSTLRQTYGTPKVVEAPVPAPVIEPISSRYAKTQGNASQRAWYNNPTDMGTPNNDANLIRSKYGSPATEVASTLPSEQVPSNSVQAKENFIKANRGRVHVEPNGQISLFEGLKTLGKSGALKGVGEMAGRANMFGMVLDPALQLVRTWKYKYSTPQEYDATYGVGSYDKDHAATEEANRRIQSTNPVDHALPGEDMQRMQALRYQKQGGKLANPKNRFLQGK